MGTDWVAGREYLVRIAADHVYPRHLDSLSEHDIHYNQKLSGFAVTSDAQAVRLHVVERGRPIGWYPETVCSPLEGGRPLTEKERSRLDTVTRLLKQEGLLQHVREQGWHHVEYSDWGI